MGERTLADRIKAVRDAMARVERDHPAEGLMRQMAMVANETGEKRAHIPALYRGADPDEPLI